MYLYYNYVQLNNIATQQKLQTTWYGTTHHMKYVKTNLKRWEHTSMNNGIGVLNKISNEIDIIDLM